MAPLAVAGNLTYSFDPEAIRFEPSQVFTEDTYVAFEGATAYGERSKIPFRVTSRNWQESDRMLAGIMTAFGANTKAIPIDGVGRFDGVLLGAFRRPRIEGRLVGSEMRAWDVNWGDVDGDFVVENSYANVSRAVIRSGLSRMDVTGQFSLGYPRADGGEEIDARIRVTERAMADFREAFDLQDYEVDGSAVGRLPCLRPLRRAARLRPHDDCPRHRLRRAVRRGRDARCASRAPASGSTPCRCTKGGGLITGAAYVGWNGTYSFNADGRRHRRRDPGADDLSRATRRIFGSLDFSASGTGTFEVPRYDVRFSASDLFFGDEGIGEMSGRLSMRGLLMTYEMEVASTRLAVSGTGRIELNDEMDAELSFRVSDTSLDPFIRAFQPAFSPFTSAIASGTIRVVGELYNPDALRIDTAVESVDLQLVDYRLRNAAPIRLSVEGQTLQVDALRLVGDGTELDLTGTVDLRDQSLALQANGAANLAVLQGFVADVRSSGRAEVTARISGTAREPVVAGNALLTDGRIRQLSFPNALEELNGIVTFDASGVRLDGVTARLGGGAGALRRPHRPVRLPAERVRCHGRRARTCGLRYPEGMRSLVDVTLALQGPAASPVVTGTVMVKNASWTRGIDTSGGLFSGLTGGDPALPTVQGQVAPRRRCASTCGCWRRRRCTSTTTRRASSPAPTCRCAARSIGRWCSAAPRSCAATSSSRAAATW